MRNAIEDAVKQIIEANPDISDADLWLAFLDLNVLEIAENNGIGHYDVLAQKNQIFAAACGYVSAPGTKYPTVDDERKGKGPTCPPHLLLTAQLDTPPVVW